MPRFFSFPTADSRFPGPLRLSAFLSQLEQGQGRTAGDASTWSADLLLLRPVSTRKCESRSSPWRGDACAAVAAVSSDRLAVGDVLVLRARGRNVLGHCDIWFSRSRTRAPEESW